MKINNPKVSIIIPVYNGSNYLKEAIDSALAQTYKNCEVIVINDGSNDNGKTEEISLSYGNKIRYYKKDNGGVATALNLGIERMEGEYFSWLSHDDMYVEHKIETQILDLLQSEQPYEIAFSNFISRDISKRLDVSSELQMRYPLKQLQRGRFSVWIGGIHGCSLLIHKSHFQRVGLFDPTLRTTQDYDLWFRMFQGQTLKFFEENLVIARKHDDQGSQTIDVHMTERIVLYQSFIKQQVSKETEWEFISEYQFLSTMIMKFYQWGMSDLARQLKMRLVVVEEPVKVKEGLLEFQKDFMKLIKGCNQVGIFGAGYQGNYMANELRGRGISADIFIDNSSEKQNTIINGMLCQAPELIDWSTTAVILAFDGSEDIKNELINKGASKIINRRWFTLQFFQVPPKKEYLMET